MQIILETCLDLLSMLHVCGVATIIFLDRVIGMVIGIVMGRNDKEILSFISRKKKSPPSVMVTRKSNGLQESK
jgi:hypothetical protein